MSGSIPSWSLEGKIAVVTGSGRGIGAAMAIELGKRGAKVVVNYANSADAAEEIVAEIKKNGSDAIAIKANVANVAETIELFDKTVAHFGKLDICCSNSGVVSFGHFKDVTEEEFDRVFKINTRGQFFVAREAYKHMSVGGRIILMGSITGQAKGVPKHAVYSGSKGAIETFTRCMAIDCGDKKITVNCVAPGGIKTDMYHAVCREYIPGGDKLSNDQVDEYAATWSPMTRVGQPVDIARVVCFLASQDGEWVNGKVIGIDGAACIQLISVVVWIVFASVYPDNILYKSHKRSLWNLYDVRPGVDQLNPLTNGNTHWITFLSVGSSKYSLGDLIAISGIKNLASLSLYQEQALLATALDDRIIRNWVRYVCGSDQPALLRRLRQLKFVAQPEITAVSVKHLSALPALVQIEFLACGSSNFLTNGIKDLGWHRPYNDWIPQQTDLARGRPPTDCPNFCEEPSEAVLHVEIMGKRFASYGDKEPDIAIHLCRYPQNTNKISEGVERSGKSYKQQQQLESPVEKHLQEESRVPPAKRRMLKPERRSNLDDTVKKLMS
ncbi:MAG: hypothetical protein M1821_004630 [Bathelium mastoideum]|nr:MAG: hypothetical protein M1821_004630 [Bathelium mastoideum]